MTNENLTLSKVMARLESRLDPMINENHQYRPNIRLKRSAAYITREEFECLSKEVEELIYFQESTLLQQDLLEMISNLEVKTELKEGE